VKKGERLAQLLVLPVATPAPVEVEELGLTARGAGGFGSTGR
jgi:dUTP pyrophosphatase